MKTQKFLWGAATSAHQIEGHNKHSDWWAWEQAGHIEGGARSGAACDHVRLFKEDLAQAKALGLNSYRFSVEWAKVEPTQGEWNKEALAWYDELLAECERLELEPMLTLHHFTLPQWVAEKGGLCAPDFPKWFVAYTEKIAGLWGKRVRLWCTFNEPMVLVAGAYIGQFMPPAVYAPASAAMASCRMLEAHVLSYDLIKKIVPQAQVSIAHNMIAFMPDRAWHPMERLMAYSFDRFYNRSWINALMGRRQHFSIPFFIPSLPQVKVALGRKTIDFLGVNYYTKAYVQWRPRDNSNQNSSNMPLGLAFARRREEQSDLGWAIFPEGLEKILESLRNLKLPLYITENGIADRDDKVRPKYLFSHLQVIAKMRASGLDLRGYFYWSLLDNFEWIKGFGPRFGLLAVNYETQERTERPAARLFREICNFHKDRAPEVKTLKEIWERFSAQYLN